MPKTLRIAFTGSCVLTPAYGDPDSQGQIPPKAGPLTAIMPGARRVRRSSFINEQINAQFSFVMFPYRHLSVDSRQHRDADYKYPDVRSVTDGLCFFEQEEIRLLTPPTNTQLTFDSDPRISTLTTASHGAQWIARWEDFAAGGNPAIRQNVLRSPGDYVRVVLPAGHVTGEFVAEPIARINFDYGTAPVTQAYAQQIVVTLTFADEAQEVTLASTLFRSRPGDPTLLTFRWHDQSAITILFGNGALASIENVLRGPFLGQDHQGDYDLEFEVLEDVVFCKPDHLNRLPLPLIKNHETLRVPCISTMVTPTDGGALAEENPEIPVAGETEESSRETKAKTATIIERRREPGESRDPNRRKL